MYPDPCLAESTLGEVVPHTLRARGYVFFAREAAARRPPSEVRAAAFVTPRRNKSCTTMLMGRATPWADRDDTIHCGHTPTRQLRNSSTVHMVSLPLPTRRTRTLTEPREGSALHDPRTPVRGSCYARSRCEWTTHFRLSTERRTAPARCIRAGAVPLVLLGDHDQSRKLSSSPRKSSPDCRDCAASSANAW